MPFLSYSVPVSDQTSEVGEKGGAPLRASDGAVHRVSELGEWH